MSGVDDPPGVHEVGLDGCGLGVADDRTGVVDGHPRVGGQIEVRAAPLLPDEVLSERRLAAVVQLIGDNHTADRHEVVAGRSANRVPGGFHRHAPSGSASSTPSDIERTRSTYTSSDSSCDAATHAVPLAVASRSVWNIASAHSAF